MALLLPGSVPRLERQEESGGTAMTENVRPYPHQGPGPQDQPPATAVARDEAANVGRSAGEAGGRVAQTAADQAREVVSETARQARDLFGEASGHARDQASGQQQRAAR